MKAQNAHLLLVVLLFFCLGNLCAQAPATPSLQEQLEAQYKLTKVGSHGGQAGVAEAGTVLSVQKSGLLAIASRSPALCPAKFENGILKGPGAMCRTLLHSDARDFALGEKVYVTKIQVNPDKDKIEFWLVQCDSCAGLTEPSSLKSLVAFQFPKKTLHNMSVPQVDDVISQVLAIDETGEQQNQVAQEQETGVRAQTSATNPAEMLTNNEVLTMLKAKLGNPIVVEKIRTSGCNYDMSINALLLLKNQGANDDIIQAMQECQRRSQSVASGK